MDKNVYHEMAEEQDDHWWFKARREILNTGINNLTLCPKAQILEVGCGPGGNLLMLKKFGHVYATEMNEFAIQHAKKVTGIDVQQGWLPDNIPFKHIKFDLICLFDVLEHIQDDDNALRSLKRLLKTNGVILLTVPAYPWLYGTHDKILHHYRRYTKRMLSKKLEIHGFKIYKMDYFSSLLFPIVLITRLADILTKRSESIGHSMPNSFLNFILYTIFRSERFILKKCGFPFGASIMAVTGKGKC